MNLKKKTLQRTRQSFNNIFTIMLGLNQVTNTYTGKKVFKRSLMAEYKRYISYPICFSLLKGMMGF